MAANAPSRSPLPHFTRQVLIVLGLITVALFLWRIAPVIVLAFAGIVFAEAIRAGSEPLARRLHLSDTVAVFIVAALAVTVLVATGWLFGRQITEQTTELWIALDEAWIKFQQFLYKTPFASRMLENAQSSPDPEALTKIAKGTFTVFGAVVDTLLVLFLALYFAVDPRTYQRGLLHLFPVGARERIQRALTASSRALRRWLVGQLAAMVTVGLLTGIGLMIIGVPLAIPLAILSGLLDFVPVVGPLAAALPGILIAFSQSPETALYAALVYTVVQFLEGNVVTPLAQKWAVHVPPALTLLGIVGFGLVFGVAGVLFAMPMLVVTMVMVQKLYIERIEK